MGAGQLREANGNGGTALEEAGWGTRFREASEEHDAGRKQGSAHHSAHHARCLARHTPYQLIHFKNKSFCFPSLLALSLPTITHTHSRHLPTLSRVD